MEQTPQRDGAARPAPGNGNTRQRPNLPTRDPTSREGGRRTSAGDEQRHCGPSHTELNIRNKRRLEALSRRYPR